MTKQKAIEWLKAISAIQTESIHKNSLLERKEALHMAIESLEKDNNGWIPCSVRLPEGKETHKVLVADKDGIMAVCYFLEVAKAFKVSWDGEEFQGVVAWQPLPEPYNDLAEE